jgi:hypothetical protein
MFLHHLHIEYIQYKFGNTGISLTKWCHIFDILSNLQKELSIMIENRYAEGK